MKAISKTSKLTQQNSVIFNMVVTQAIVLQSRESEFELCDIEIEEPQPNEVSQYPAQVSRIRRDSLNCA